MDSKVIILLAVFQDASVTTTRPDVTLTPRFTRRPAVSAAVYATIVGITPWDATARSANHSSSLTHPETSGTQRYASVCTMLFVVKKSC